MLPAAVILIINCCFQLAASPRKLLTCEFCILFSFFIHPHLKYLLHRTTSPASGG